jgi:hypothetical protein
MKATKGTVLVCVIGMPFLVALSLSAKQAANSATDDQELNLKAYETLLRSDVNGKREAIVKEILQLSDSDGEKFWPVYREYESERSKLDLAEAQLMNQYVKDYQTMSDAEADQLMSKSFDLEAQRAGLKKKYFETMKKDVSASTAARFFEVDSQLQHISDLQTAAKLPANQ